MRTAAHPRLGGSQALGGRNSQSLPGIVRFNRVTGQCSYPKDRAPCPKFLVDNAYLSLEPSNDHERAIARIVDCVELRSKSYSIAIEEVIAVLDFTVSKSDGDFLLEYIRWRMDHPIVK